VDNTEAIRERLLKRRDELRQRASDASADLRHEADPLSADFAEQVTQRENDDVLGAISSSARAELQQVESALRRLASGRYSTCRVCGGDIEPERLAAVPCTDCCRACAESVSSGRIQAGRGAHR
jgi:DnaK suppressor protein